MSRKKKKQADPHFPYASEEELGEADQYYEKLVLKLPEPKKFSRGSVILDLIGQLATRQFFRISVPIVFVSPISLLHLMSMYFTPIPAFLSISRARNEEDRFLRVVKWAMLNIKRMIHPEGFCHAKPYNPVLGEQHVFKINLPVKGGGVNVTRGIAEQVSHHPPISALYLSNRKSNFSMRGTIFPKSKISPNSMALSMYGEINFCVHNLDEEYFLQIPPLVSYGILMGKRFIEHTGLYRIECPKTGLTFMMWFKAKQQSKIVGRIWKGKGTPDEKILYRFSGYANKKILIRPTRTQKVSVFVDNEVAKVPAQILKNVKDQPPNHSQRNWHMVTKSLLDGELKAAAKYKDGVEQAQRKKRAERRESGVEFATEHFDVFKRVTQKAHTMSEEEGEVESEAAAAEKHTVPLYKHKLENRTAYQEGTEDPFESLEIFNY